jgi:hypothetical protein
MDNTFKSNYKKNSSVFSALKEKKVHLIINQHTFGKTVVDFLVSFASPISVVLISKYSFSRSSDVMIPSSVTPNEDC